MRCAFLGSPPFATAVLNRVLESGHPVVVLLTQPDRPQGRGRRTESDGSSPFVARARAAGIPVVQPENPHDPAVLQELRRLAPDVCLVASYGVILRRELLDLPRHGCLNVHASLLPRYRGASPIAHAILAGETRTGVSVQRIVPALDQGDVLVAREEAIRPDDTAGTLRERLSVLGGDAAALALDQLEAGTAVFVPQNPALASYAPKLRKEDGRIRSSDPAEHIERRVRAMNPWPMAHTTLPGNKELQVLRARLVDLPQGQSAPAGQVLLAGGAFVVAAGNGALELLEVRPAGRKFMEGVAFLRGARLEIGAPLGG